jgi:hypothetical protein
MARTQRGGMEYATMITRYDNHVFEDLIYEPKYKALFHKKIEIPWKLIYVMSYSKRRNRKKRNNWKPYSYESIVVPDVEGVECEIHKNKIEKILKHLWSINKKGKLINMNI